MKILVKDFCENTITQDEGEKLQRAIKPYYDNNETIELDFSGFNKFVTIFFNSSIGHYILTDSPEKFQSLVTAINLSEVGKTVYEFSLKNAIKQYKEKLPAKTSEIIKKKTHENITNI